MKKISLFIGIFSLAVGFLLGQLNIVGMVQRVSAIGNSSFIPMGTIPMNSRLGTAYKTHPIPYALPRAVFAQTYAVGGGYAYSPSYVDINGDGLVDMMYSAPSGLDNSSNSVSWFQMVALNNGEGFDVVYTCMERRIQEGSPTYPTYRMEYQGDCVE
jgi:hypothetical protein